MSKEKDTEQQSTPPPSVANGQQSKEPTELSPVALDSVAGGFALAAGDTVTDVLAREAGRTLVDPSSGQEATLRDLYGAAGVDTSGTGVKHHKK